MKQIILGTAGHIDHGKTSLIKALTGIDTDRLKEEKQRGITIELGFAHLTLPGGQVLGIVDVPGHEKFVKNMVAGATGIDLVALVIAADEGVMPQTKEHLEICELLKIRHGLVVLTKIDMVDEDWLEMVKDDVSEYLSHTFLSDFPMVEVSAVTGQGMDDLVQVLDGLTQDIPEKDPGHIFRVPVDRVFSMKGFGTVITGTSISGTVKVGDDISIYPREIYSKVRGLQVHNQDVETVRSGLRTAINLQGIEKAVIQRGDVLASKDALHVTYMVDVRLDLLAAAPRNLKNRARVRFHSGTCEIMARVVLLDRDELKPGESCFAQIRLDEPTVVLKNDRYVLRSYSPVRTIGGGEVVNALPGTKKKRFSDPVLSEMESLHTGDLDELIHTFIFLGRFRGVEQGGLPFLTNTAKKKVDDVLKKLLAQQKVSQYDKERGAMIHGDFLAKAQKEILDTLTGYHQDNPLKAGLLKEELRSRTLGSDHPKLFNYIMNNLMQDNIIVQENEIVRLEGHQVTLALDQEEARQKLEQLYGESGLKPPYVKEWQGTFPGSIGQDVLGVMVKEGVLLKVSEELYFHKQAIEGLENRLIDFLRKNGEITTPQFKELADVSRKYAIPLIEYFDGKQLTVRVGDNRVLRKQ